MLLLIIDLLEKKITESQDRRNFDGARPLFIICTRVTTLHSCYNFVLVFSQSEACNVSIYIIRP